MRTVLVISAFILATVCGVLGGTTSKAYNTYGTYGTLDGYGLDGRSLLYDNYYRSDYPAAVKSQYQYPYYAAGYGAPAAAAAYLPYRGYGLNSAYYDYSYGYRPRDYVPSAYLGGYGYPYDLLKK